METKRRNKTEKTNRKEGKLMNTKKTDRPFIDTAKYKSYSKKTRLQLRAIRRTERSEIKAKNEKEEKEIKPK